MTSRLPPSRACHSARVLPDRTLEFGEDAGTLLGAQMLQALLEGGGLQRILEFGIATIHSQMLTSNLLCVARFSVRRRPHPCAVARQAASGRRFSSASP